MAESNGVPDPYSQESLLVRRIAELEAALEKSNFERDKARKNFNDLCDQVMPNDRFTEEDIEKMLAEGGHTTISEILLEFGYPEKDAA